MNGLQDRISPIADKGTVSALPRRPRTEQRHTKVRLRDGGMLLERCEQEPCLVNRVGRASCGRLACLVCGRGSANLSAWQLAGLAAGERVACDCGHSWIPRPADHPAPETALIGSTATSKGVEQ